VSRRNGASPVYTAARGQGPQDGFSEYEFFGSTPGVPEPRWGDYGAAATDGRVIWFASEYTGQACTFEVFKDDPTCGGTRTTLANWYTRISAYRP
jgi:hypothetical protein